MNLYAPGDEIPLAAILADDPALAWDPGQPDADFPAEAARRKPTKNRPIPMDAPAPVLKRKVRRRVFHNRLRTKNAITTLKELPGADETHHYLMPGSYDSFDLIDAMLHRAAPEEIEDLRLASLGFNSANASRLTELLEQQRVQVATLLVSVYYEADRKEADVCHGLADVLPRYGGWFCASRNHAKVIAARFTDGRCFVIESSANLRSCRNIEQFTISNSEPLFQFHRQWMEEANDREVRRRARLRTR